MKQRQDWYKRVYKRWGSLQVHAALLTGAETLCGTQLDSHHDRIIRKRVDCEKCCEAMVRYNTEAIGKVSLSTRRGQDGWVRPSLVLNGAGASVEIIRENGERLCLLNIATNPDGWGNLDVILTEGLDKDLKLTAIAWKPEGGGQAFREVSPGWLVAVDISKKEVKG